MDTPSEIGATAEREVAYALERAGRAVFLPFFDTHSRIDLVAIGVTGAATRVQVKTAPLSQDGTVVVYRTCSNTKNVPAAYNGEVDAFGFWCPALQRAYLMPIEDAPARGGHLRVVPAANGQAVGVRFASDYEIRPAAAGMLTE